MGKTSDPRHNARRLALTSIFCWLFSDTDESSCQDLAEKLLECNQVDHQLSNKLIKGVQKNNEEIDKLIQEAAPEWPVDKISKVDLVILRIAVYELLHCEDIPEKVAIDEAIELAKEFGNDSASKFVNGVLGTVLERKTESE